MKQCLIAATVGLLSTMPALAQQNNWSGNCGIQSYIVGSLQAKLATVVNESDGNGGLFKPKQDVVGRGRSAGRSLLGREQQSRRLARKPLDRHRQGQHRQ